VPLSRTVLWGSIHTDPIWTVRMRIRNNDFDGFPMFVSGVTETNKTGAWPPESASCYSASFPLLANGSEAGIFVALDARYALISYTVLLLRNSTISYILL